MNTYLPSKIFDKEASYNAFSWYTQRKLSVPSSQASQLTLSSADDSVDFPAAYASQLRERTHREPPGVRVVPWELVQSLFETMHE